MSFDLLAMVRSDVARRRRNADAVVIRGIEVTQTIENELRAIILQVVNYWGAASRDVIIPLYENEIAAMRFVRDDANDNMRAAVDAVAEGSSRLVLTLGPLVSDWTLRVQRWHNGRWTDGVRSATGFDITSLIADLSAAEEVTAYREWASSLIRNVDDDMRRRVENSVYRGFASQSPRRIIANEIADAMRIGRARARFIARDQANKLSGKLDELRHREAGVDQYRWETARDERVRDTHRANQGKIFRWDKPPRVTGHPRTEPNCRCTPQPYLAILEGVDPSKTEADIEFV